MKKIIMAVLFLLFQASAFAISATGYGNTPKEARDAALSELSNIVVANVKSTLSSTTSVSGQKVSKDAKQELEVSSATYFQGVQYSDATKTAQGYEVTALLSEEGIANTLNYIKKELDKDLAKLSKSDLKNLLKMSEIGYALANFSGSKSSDQARIKEREDEVLKYLSYGQIFFNITPAGAKLVIDNQEYQPFTLYLLPAKSYTYQVSSEGYYGEEGKFYLNSAKKNEVRITLVRKSGVKPLIYLDIDKSLSASAKEVFTQYKVDITDEPQSTNAIRFRFKTSFVTQVDDLKVYNLTVIAEAFKGKKSYIVKRAQIKNVTDANLEAKKASGVAALAKYLMKKLDMETFIGSERVDYSTLF